MALVTNPEYVFGVFKPQTSTFSEKIKSILFMINRKQIYYNRKDWQYCYYHKLFFESRGEYFIPPFAKIPIPDTKQPAVVLLLSDKPIEQIVPLFEKQHPVLNFDWKPFAVDEVG